MSNTGFVVFAALGYKALMLMYIWLGSAIIASLLSRSKGYGEKPGLGTGMLLSIAGPIIWLFVPPKDENAEWHTRKPWQPRKKPTEAEMSELKASRATSGTSAAGGTSGTDAAGGTPGAGSRPGESRDS
jgi:hypothetical protein